MDTEDSPEVLDDLRKKRLAYYEAFKQSQLESRQTQELQQLHTGQNSTNEIGQHYEHTGQKLHNALKVNLKPKANPENLSTETGTGSFLHDINSNHSHPTKMSSIEESHVTTNGKHYEETKNTSSTTTVKTSAFYLSNPEITVRPNQAKHEHQRDQPHLITTQISAPVAALTTTTANTGSHVDGYNETVERLIRATKEELLGKKSNDDIWSTLRQVSVSEAEKDSSAESYEAYNNQSDHEQKYFTQPSQNTFNIDSSKNSSSSSPSHMFSRANSDNTAYRNMPQTIQSYDEEGPKAAANFEESHNGSNSSKYYSDKPMYSDLEPVQQWHHVGKQETQKSFNTAKVEEIFSSRQLSRSQAQLYSDVKDSQDLETIPRPPTVHESLSLSELGLSTHRPESERKMDDVEAEAEDINLGDTITKELRSLLGEEKFQQFVQKSKKDIDELHQSDRSEQSARKDKTPRLIKDKTPNKTASSTLNDFSKERNTGISKNKTTNQRDAMPRNEAGMPRKTSASENGEKVDIKLETSTLNRSQEFTPRLSDGDAVQNMIGQFVLSKKDVDTSKRLISNPAYKEKPATKVKQENMEITKPVPELNLAEITQSESPRPKLNRPKHEPYTIYQERQKIDHEGKEKPNTPEKVATDTSLGAGKNYEQITMPRNVAFAASEIYHQAYGAFYAEHAGEVMMSPHYPAGHVTQSMMQYGVPPGVGLSAPMTPTTPGGTVPMSQAYMLNQMYSTQYASMHHGEDAARVKQQQQQQHHQYLTRQSSLTSDTGIPIPHPPNQPLQPPLGSPYNQMYGSMPDFKGFSPGMVPRFPGPAIAADQSIHIPHPPVSSDTQANMGGHRYTQPNMDGQRYTQAIMDGQSYTEASMGGHSYTEASMGGPSYTQANMGGHRYTQPNMDGKRYTQASMGGQSYTQASMGGQSYTEASMGGQSYTHANMGGQQYIQPNIGGQSYTPPNMAATYPTSTAMPIGYPYQYPVMMMMTPHPPPMESPQTPTSIQMMIPFQHPTPTSIQQQMAVPVPPQTPTMSNAEVQTEREEATQEKVTVVEESTFTSVSQIKDDIFVPHPPPTKKENRPSPRRQPKMDLAQQNMQDSKRHIDGIRQHHEQRRQQQEDEKLTDEQMLEKQRRFAKASLDRYFSSLENLYKPSHKNRSRNSLSEHSSQASEDREEHFQQQNDEEFDTERDVTKPDGDDVMDDVISTTYHQAKANLNVSLSDFVDLPEKPDDQDLAKSAQKLKLSGNGAVRDIVNTTCMDSNADNSDNNSDFVGETLVNSEVTGVSLKAGGVTERLNDLGIDVTQFKFEKREVTADVDNKMEGEKRKKEKKGKVLIICPECNKFNKDYMSWCTHCGEMIIGVEPMLVSKNREGKVRTKPLKKDENEVEKEVNNNNMNILKNNSETVLTQIPLEVNYVQEIPEKPFSLNLEGIKSPEEGVLNETKDSSPIKSDGKDSGRPSSDDPDNEILNMKMEQEVVDDICGSISDPVVKGYLMSHFAKKHQAILDGKTKEKLHEELVMSGLSHTVTDTRQLIHEEMKTKDAVNNNQAHAAGKVIEHENDIQHASEKEFAQLLVNTQDSVKAKIAMFNEKKSDNQCERVKKNDKHFTEHVENLDSPKLIEENKDILLVPPPLPNFSATEPVCHNELALKLPANSMDFSADYSQAGSTTFDAASRVLKDGQTEAEAKDERRKERRRRRGHGAIDVEVFGYKESRESRNTSRGLKLVPTLNLAGNSSDEDDLSFQSDVTKSEAGPTHPMAASFSAWEPAVIREVIEEIWEPEVIPEEVFQGDISRSPDGARANENISSPGNLSPAIVVEQQQQQNDRGHGEPSEEWQQLFIPELAHEDNQEPEDDDDEEVREDADLDQPFLMQVINQQPTTSKSKQRPKSSKGKSVKSKVRQSMEGPGYQRKWARSSTAWSSFNPGELSTSSSLRLSLDQGRARPSSGARPSSARPSSAAKGRNLDNSESEPQDGRETSPVRQPGKKGRPASADLYRRKQQKQKGQRNSNHGDDLDMELNLVTDMVEHRLPRQGMLERLQAMVEVPQNADHMASPKSTYDKLLEMTPRIQAGTLSRWQCLPDEILLHVFAYLDQSTLTKCAEVCYQFYRVSMDESLWKYITVKKKSDLDDNCLQEISKRHPISLALIQCRGEHVTAKGLRDLFMECADSLKELNIARCSQGALLGDSLLLHAAARCRNITHIDTSWCNVTDSGLMAISNTCNRLESLCINGCQAVTNDGLETVIKRHGVNLRVLEMFGCFNISPRGLRCISNNCINLLTLNLGQCYKLTDSCISQLSSSLGRVESLDLRGCKQIKDNCMRRVVKNCTRLKHLSLANCPNITDVSVLEISTYLPDIRSIDLCGCKQITDGSIRALVNTCTNLRSIDISSTSCTHRSVSMIANFSSQRLEMLKINFLADVTEQSLIKLAKHCHKLKSVHMYGCTSVRNLTKVKEERPSFTIEM